MKIIAYILVVLSLPFLSGCEWNDPLEENDVQRELVFHIEPGELNDESNASSCIEQADYALLILSTPTGNETHYLDLIPATSGVTTERLLLPLGDYAVNELLLFESKGHPETRGDDQLVSASPHQDSEYGNLTPHALEYLFTLNDTNNNEHTLTVFCFDPLKDADWKTKFNFIWFEPQFTVLQEALFYGDFCTDQFLAYQGSLYGEFPKVDMPAIFNIQLYVDQDGDGTYETLLSDRNNEENYLNSADGTFVPPLSITYPDMPDQEDYFKMVVSIYELIGIDTETRERKFDYKYFESWYFTNSAEIMFKDPDYRTNPENLVSVGPGKDGIYDFIVGPCTVIEWDIDINDPDYGDEVTTETAYARHDNHATCFLEFGFSRWGWTNQLENKNKATYQLPIWAGAGQCDTDKGSKVGYLLVEIGKDNQASITYQLDEGYDLEETHLYVGEKILPEKKGNYTIASGQFPYKHENLSGSSSDEYTVSIPEGAFYLVAHAVVK